MGDPRDKKRKQAKTGNGHGSNGGGSAKPEERYLAVAREVGLSLKITNGKKGMHTVCVKRPDGSAICTLNLDPQNVEVGCSQIKSAATRPTAIEYRARTVHGQPSGRR